MGMIGDGYDVGGTWLTARRRAGDDGRVLTCCLCGGGEFVTSRGMGDYWKCPRPLVRAVGSRVVAVPGRCSGCACVVCVCREMRESGYMCWLCHNAGVPHADDCECDGWGVCVELFEWRAPGESLAAVCASSRRRAEIKVRMWIWQIGTPIAFWGSHRKENDQ